MLVSPKKGKYNSATALKLLKTNPRIPNAEMKKTAYL